MKLPPEAPSIQLRHLLGNKINEKVCLANVLEVRMLWRLLRYSRGLEVAKAQRVLSSSKPFPLVKGLEASI